MIGSSLVGSKEDDFLRGGGSLLQNIYIPPSKLAILLVAKARSFHLFCPLS